MNSDLSEIRVCQECGEHIWRTDDRAQDHAVDCSLRPESQRERFEREDNRRRRVYKLEAK